MDQAKAQMAVWSIMPSPLIFSADIRTLQPEMKALLQNTYIINVNQDPLRLPGYRLRNVSSREKKYGTLRKSRGFFRN